MKVKSESEVAQPCLTLSDPMDCSLPELLGPWDFPGQEHWSGVPLPSPKQLRDVSQFVSQLHADDPGWGAGERALETTARECRGVAKPVAQEPHTGQGSVTYLCETTWVTPQRAHFPIDKTASFLLQGKARRKCA